MENIIVNETKEVKVNYIKEFYKNPERNYDAFFNKEAQVTSDIAILSAKINKIKDDLSEQESKLEELYCKGYEKQYIANTRTVLLSYSGRSGGTHYYLYPLGYEVKIEDYENPIVIVLSTKNEVIHVISGYCYELGAVIAKYYSAKISSDNSKVTLRLNHEIMLGVLEDKVVWDNGSHYIDTWDKAKILNQVNAKEFIDNMFGIEYNGKLSLGEIANCFRNNPAFETILKTAPEEIMDMLLQMKGIDKPKSIPAILGLSPELYDTALSKGYLLPVIELLPYIQNNEMFHKTAAEWLDLIEACKAAEEDFDFYHISYKITYYYRCASNQKEPEHCYILGIIAHEYARYETLRKYYSFGKLVSYVIDAIINQGYKSIRDFFTELIDYMVMCNNQQITPTLYSAYLTQIHNIQSRNHKVFVEEHEEEIFQSRYKDFKEIKTDKYIFIAPKCSKDLEIEGNSQSSCVGSYIKRVINGTCLVTFMRLVEDKVHSLVTIEERDGKIAQVRGHMNRRPTNEEIEAVKVYAEKRGLTYNTSIY